MVHGVSSSHLLCCMLRIRFAISGTIGTSCACNTSHASDTSCYESCAVHHIMWSCTHTHVGTALFYLVYEQLYAWLNAPVTTETHPVRDALLATKIENATLAWIISYVASILWQHALHRYIAFGAHGSYLRSLIWTYISYTLSIILSSIINHILVSYLSFDHRISFNLTLAITGVINFFTLKKAFAVDEVKQE